MFALITDYGEPDPNTLRFLYLILHTVLLIPLAYTIVSFIFKEASYDSR